MSDLILFKQALGEAAWLRLAPAIRQHYALDPVFSQSRFLTGIMAEVFHAPWIKPLLWLAQWFNALVADTGRNVPVTVKNWTDAKQPDSVFWHRQFSFDNGKTAIFNSRMQAGNAGEIIEFLRFGIGVRMAVSEQDGALHFVAREHCWQIGPWLFGIPNSLLLGDALIIERAISANEIGLEFAITHPIFGRTFGYCGRFRIEPPSGH